MNGSENNKAIAQLTFVGAFLAHTMRSIRSKEGTHKGGGSPGIIPSIVTPKDNDGPTAQCSRIQPLESRSDEHAQGLIILFHILSQAVIRLNLYAHI